MPDLSHIIQVGAAHAWFYLPVAVVLGALHALEPGHAKSLMVAYIVSIRGTPKQAALLGLSAAIGHTIVVWFLAIAALLLGQNLLAEQAEPWLTLLSGILVTLLALRMFVRLRAANHGHHHHHDNIMTIRTVMITHTNTFSQKLERRHLTSLVWIQRRSIAMSSRDCRSAGLHSTQAGHSWSSHGCGV